MLWSILFIRSLPFCKDFIGNNYFKTNVIANMESRKSEVDCLLAIMCRDTLWIVLNIVMDCLLDFWNSIPELLPAWKNFKIFASKMVSRHFNISYVPQPVDRQPYTFTQRVQVFRQVLQYLLRSHAVSLVSQTKPFYIYQYVCCMV